MNIFVRGILGGSVIILPIASLGIENGASAPVDLTSLSLEELMKINVLDTPVSSVSKKTQRLADAPAAVSVITQDDIHRSGLQALPDLLRLAPGMTVARFNANEWAVSARGFGAIFANKLLVLQDGRTLYNHGFSGVFWGSQDAVLADIDHIEVVRGPGATLWGSNAVNGVINIVTKDASQTLGFLSDAFAGTDMQAESLRYGFKLDDKTSARVYGKFRMIDDSIYSQMAGELAGQDANDQLRDGRGGFRIDRAVSDTTHWMMEGEAMTSKTGRTTLISELAPPWNLPVDNDVDIDSGHVLSAWSGATAETEYLFRAYFSRYQTLSDSYVKYTEDTADIEYQHRWRTSEHHEMNWGMGYRAIMDSSESSTLNLDPDSDVSHDFNMFFQDCWTLVPGKLNLYLGSKLEFSSYADPAIQPSLRMAWTPDPGHTFWAAASRAIRTPSRGEQNTRWRYSTEIDPNTGYPVVVNVMGNPAMDSEELYAYELGYRFQSSKDLTIELAGFFNNYRRLGSSEYSPAYLVNEPYPHAEINAWVDNQVSGKTWGLELSADWRVAKNWKLTGSYSWIDGNFATLDVATSGLQNYGPEGLEEALIHNQFQIHSAWDIAPDLSLNTSLYYQDLVQSDRVPPFIRLDLNLAWRPNKNAEVIVGASSLLNDSYPQWLENSDRNLGTEVERAVYIRTIFKF